MSWLTRLLAVFSAAVVGTAVTSGSAEAQKRSIRELKIPEKWSVGQGTHDGKPIITRFNIGLKPFVGDSEFPNQLGIAVPFKQHSANGLPTTAEIKELDAIEDEIVRRFTIGNESLFAGVVTTDNMREFILYTSNTKAAAGKAEKLRKDITTHAIQFEMHDDPEWQNFKNLAPK